MIAVIVVWPRPGKKRGIWVAAVKKQGSVLRLINDVISDQFIDLSTR